MKFKRWYPELIGLVVAAFATRIWDLFYPNAVVFDEVYFKAFAAHYLDHHYYFDIHPPLGKLILAGYAALLHLDPSAMLTGTALPLRWLPAIAGTLLVPLMWALLRRLGANRPLAFLGALLVLLDNALLVESRFILMDSMLLLFGVGAVYLYLVARDNQGPWRWTWLALAAASAGAAMSIKWTGLNALAIIALIWAWDQKGRTAGLGRRLGELAVIFLVPLIMYTATFWVHFQLLPLTGDGDAFMSQRFQATLQGNPNYTAGADLPFWQKFIEINHEMYHANQTLTATHPYGSHWYTWPLEQRPIYYWEGSVLADGKQGNIYLLGNPIIWWGLWIAIAAGLARIALTNRALKPQTTSVLAIAFAGYMINLLPFVGVTRVMFLYHYFFSLLYSIVFAVVLWGDLSQPLEGQTPKVNWRRVYGAAIVLVALGFIFFAPLSYGTPLSPAGLQARMWLPTWR
jgi:dolichyl-phosphate-mannose-protein mannosyltransferase